MRLTKAQHLKNSLSRKTGYYWVGWHLEPDGTTEYKRIGYFDSRLGHWFFPGDNRRYLDEDLLSIYEMPVAKIPYVSRWAKFINWVATIIVLWWLSNVVKFLIDYITK